MKGSLKEPIVAVLIPVFNGERFLGETLKSVFIQDYESKLVIICNDGSTDGSQRIIESVVAESESEIVILQHEKNLGLSKSLVDLCDAAKPVADIAIILGQDDLIPHDYIRKISRHFIQDEDLIVSTRALCINEASERINESHTPPSINFLRAYKTAFLLAANQVNAPGVAFSLRTFIPEFVGTGNPLTQDWHQWIFSSTKATTKVSCDTNVFYRKHTESLTSHGSDFDGHMEISKARLEFLASRQFAEFVEPWTSHQRRTFLAVTRFLFCEFNHCSHNSEFLEQLSEKLVGGKRNRAKVKHVEYCDGRVGLSKADSRRRSSNREATSKSMVPDSTLVNFAHILLSTLRLLTGRPIHAIVKRLHQFLRSVGQLTIYSAGGLGAQLSALSYAIWLKDKFSRSVKIVFHEMGLTYYPIVIEDLLVDVSYDIVRWEPHAEHESAVTNTNLELEVSHSANAIIHLRSLIKKALFPLRLVVSEEHLSKTALNGVKKSTKYIKGYHTDWSVIHESWDSLSELISQFREHNFMSDGGSEPTISIHWRLGDFLNNPIANHTHGTVSPEALLLCLRTIKGELDISNVQVFTDSPEVAKSKLMALESEFRFSFFFGDIWEDLYLMSRSQAFIGSHSSISAWAAFSIARANPNSLVYLPIQWFKNDPTGFNKGGNHFRNPQEIITNIRGYDARLN